MTRTCPVRLAETVSSMNWESGMRKRRQTALGMDSIVRKNPLDCLSYYPNWDSALYYLVLADGDIDEDANDSRISCTRLRLVKQLDLPEFITHSLRYICEYPFRKETSFKVQAERGEAYRGFTVVRGKKPLAKGQIGDVLGFLKEEPDSRRIAEAGIYVVDNTGNLHCFIQRS